MPPRFLYRLFPLAGRASHAVERSCTAAGRLLLGLLFAGTLFGLDARQTLAAQLAAVSFAFLAVAWLGSRYWRPALEVRRVLPDFVTAEVPMSYFVEIHNRGRRLEQDLVLGDALFTPRLDYARFQHLRAQRADDRGNWFDRAIGFPRWVELRQRERGAELALYPIPAIAPGSAVRVEIRTTPLRRGPLRFSHIDVYRPDPLGLLRARRRYRLPGTLLALPRRFAMPALQLRAARHYQRGGISLALAVGDSQEFAALRDYRAGDPRRHIHWRSFAKTGQLIVKQYQDEYFERHALVVDTHLDAADAALLEGVISVAASIAGGACAQDSILDLMFAGRDVIELSAGRGLGDAVHALSFLAQVQASGANEFDDLAELLRTRAGRLASVILVFGAWDPARERLVTELVMHGVPSLSLRLSADDALPHVRRIGDHRSYRVRISHMAEDLAQVAFGT